MRVLSRIAAGFLLIVTTSAAVAQRARAVRPVGEAVYGGSIVDATTGNPVIEAEVTSGTRTVKTNSLGQFSIVIIVGRPVSLVVHRSGYEDFPLTVSLPSSAAVSPAPIGGPSLPPIRLVSKPVVTVKLTDGGTVRFDAETVQFAYYLPFSSPATSATASFCKLDGTAYAPDRSEFARISGPATSVTNAACCKLGPALAVDVEMKNGDKERVLFTDSCFGYDVLFTGRDHDSAQYLYAKFVEIVSVDFP